MKINDNTHKTTKFIYDKFVSKELNNDSLVQIIELCGDLLNLQTISNYAKDNSMSYNGVKKYRNVVEIFKNKYVIDNN